MSKYTTDDILIRQVPILRDFLYHYSTYKELIHNVENLSGPKLFWKFTADAHLLTFVNYWCMVFGSKGNPTHYSKVDFTEEYDYVPFQEYFLEALDMTHEDYEKYWQAMKGFRDKFSAHREIGYKEPVPYFDIAHKVALHYVSWLEKYNIMPSLEMMVEQYQEELQPMIESFKVK
ncbi:hypothetical protein ACQJ0Y_07890 [Peribacillus simplex]|uniref:hypothetical protein n=1 Tax=Peribacillus simplex TaxID=1478 RepID=UPI003CF2676B